MHMLVRSERKSLYYKRCRASRFNGDGPSSICAIGAADLGTTWEQNPRSVACFWLLAPTRAIESSTSWRKRVGVECNHTRRSKDLADIPRNPYEARGMLGSGYRSPIVPSFVASLLSLPISTDPRTNALATQINQPARMASRRWIKTCTGQSTVPVITGECLPAMKEANSSASKASRSLVTTADRPNHWRLC